MTIDKAVILLVEDDPSDARLIQRAFLKYCADANMIRLTNGDDAVSYLAGHPPYENRVTYPFPDIILLDIKLPRRSGFEVLQWLRTQASELKRVPVVVLTSSSHSVDVNRAYDLGANSYVVKPDNKTQLERLASDFCDWWLGLNESPEFLARRVSRQ